MGVMIVDGVEYNVAGPARYGNLPDKPKINGVTLEGNLTSSDLHIEGSGSDIDLTDYYTKDEIDPLLVNLGSAVLSANNKIGNLSDLETQETSTLVGAINEVKSSAGTSNYSNLTNLPSLNGVTISGTKTSGDFNLLGTASKGTANGVAELDENGKVPASQLPSYVDDVIDGYLKEADEKFYKENTYLTEITGESGKIYLDVVSNKSYRWSGSAFVEISSSLALGETSSTAYAGNKGKQNADDITDLKSNKVDKVSGKGLSTNDYNNTEKEKVTNAYKSNDSASTDLVDTDYIPFYDTSASAKKKTLWSNIKSKLKTYFDTLYNTFTIGDGLDVTSNTLSTDRMESSEIDDLDIDTPGQPSGIYIDYTGTELAVGKLKLANGTVKTLYQKTVATGTISSGENTINTNITNGSNAYIYDGYLITSAGYALPLNSSVSSSAFAFSRVSTSGASIVITCNIGTVTRGYVTLRYTKTS